MTKHSIWIQFKPSDKLERIFGTCDVCGRTVYLIRQIDKQRISDAIDDVQAEFAKHACPITNPDLLVLYA